MKIDVSKKVDLSYLGEVWKECYLEFRMPSYKDIQDLPTNVDEGNTKESLEKGYRTLEGLFIGGKAISEGQPVEVKSTDLRDFPLEVITKCFKAITGEPDPKA